MNNEQLNFPSLFTDGPYQGFQEFSDATLQTENGSSFHVHKMLLGMQSEFFRALFTFEFNRRNILISDIDSKTLDSILVYMYTGHIYLNERNVHKILIASDYFLMNKLTQECRAYVIRNMSTNNCLSLFHTAWEVEKLDLFPITYRFLQTNFETVFLDPGSKVSDLDVKALKMLLSEKCLNITTEKTVWMAIVKWMENFELCRLPLIPELIKLISIADIDEDLADTIVNHPIVSNNPFCHKLNKLNNNNGSCWNMLEQFCKTEPVASNSGVSRLPDTLNIITTFLISYNPAPTEMFITFDEQLDMWQKKLNVEFPPEIMVRIRNRVYLFDTWEHKMAAYDIWDNRRLPIRQAPLTRYEYSVVQIGGDIYLSGGELDNQEPTHITERYISEIDHWTTIPDMQPMILSSTIAMDDQIYALGHIVTDFIPAMVMQVYSPITNAWTSITPPNVLRQYFATVVYKDHLIVVGGQDNDIYLKDVEKYDPELDTWSLMPDLPAPYFLPKCFVFNGNLYVFESYCDERRRYDFSPPVCWNENSQSWDIIAESSPFFNIDKYRIIIIDDKEIIRRLIVNSRLTSSKWDKSPFFQE